MRRERSTTHVDAKTPPHSRRIHREAPPKLPEPTVCPSCSASYRKGRWTWDAAADGAEEHLCPACQRIESGYPAGVLHVEGAFVEAHRQDLEHLVRNIEKRERALHPMRRIIEIQDEGTGFMVTVTDADLAMSFGRALTSAYDGEFEHPPTTADTENLVRVRWTRD